MSDARTAAQVAHDDGMVDGLDECLACGARGQWDGACPSCGALAVDITEINYHALSTPDLMDMRDAASIVINQRNKTPPWYGIWVESEAAWLTRELMPTQDVEKAMRRRRISTLESWMPNVLFRNKNYRGVVIQGLPIIIKDMNKRVKSRGDTHHTEV